MNPVTCEHHFCRCMRAAELAAMDRLQDAIAVHEQTVTCRLTEEGKSNERSDKKLRRF